MDPVAHRGRGACQTRHKSLRSGRLHRINLRAPAPAGPGRGPGTRARAFHPGFMPAFRVRGLQVCATPTAPEKPPQVPDLRHGPVDHEACHLCAGSKRPFAESQTEQGHAEARADVEAPRPPAPTLHPTRLVQESSARQRLTRSLRRSPAPARPPPACPCLTSGTIRPPRVNDTAGQTDTPQPIWPGTCSAQLDRAGVQPLPDKRSHAQDAQRFCGGPQCVLWKLCCKASRGLEVSGRRAQQIAGIRAPRHQADPVPDPSPRRQRGRAPRNASSARTRRCAAPCCARQGAQVGFRTRIAGAHRQAGQCQSSPGLGPRAGDPRRALAGRVPALRRGPASSPLPCKVCQARHQSLAPDKN